MGYLRSSSGSEQKHDIPDIPLLLSGNLRFFLLLVLFRRSVPNVKYIHTSYHVTMGFPHFIRDFLGDLNMVRLANFSAATNSRGSTRSENGSMG